MSENVDSLQDARHERLIQDVKRGLLDAMARHDAVAARRWWQAYRELLGLRSRRQVARMERRMGIRP